MRLINRTAFLVALGAAVAGSLSAQEMAGIAINDRLTITKCGGCHQRDSQGMMRRLSYIRTSPEVWEQAIKRMVRLNGLVIKPEEAREILKFLSANNGLAPEEAKPVFWEAEHRLYRDQSDKIPDDALQHTCNYCHTIGRVLTQRRTKDDYDKLIAMHLGLFPGAENQLRPRREANVGEELVMPRRRVTKRSPCRRPRAAIHRLSQRRRHWCRRARMVRLQAMWRSIIWRRISR